MSDTDKLIEELSSDVKRVKCRNPFAICHIWVMSIVIVIAFVVFFLSRPDALAIIAMPLFAVELSLALATGLLSALAACWLSTPDVKQQKWVVWLPFIPLACLGLLIGYNIVTQPLNSLLQEETAIHCVSSALGVAVVPAIVLILLLKHNANTHNVLFSVTSVMAVAAFAYFCSRLVCPKDNIEHLILWHYTPTMLIAVVAAFVGSKLLRWR